MSERDRGMAIAEIVEAYGMKLDNLPATRILVFERALRKVPDPVLRPMVDRLISTAKARYGDVPQIAEWLEAAEACRLEMLHALGKPGCCECEDSPGWRTVMSPDGSKVERCGCWKRLQEKRAELAVGDQALALPAARAELDE